MLRKRGEDATVLEDLAADDQVTTAMLSRKNRVLNCPDFTLRAGAPDGGTATPEAEALYRRFVQDLERTNLRTVISGILDAPFFGFIPLELIWRPGDNWWHLVDIVPRPPRWFRFDNENRPTFVGVYGGIAAQPVPLPAGKFVFVQHHATYDNPYGLRLLSRCLWPVAFKRGGLRFYAKFVERHGLPWVVGEAPAKAERLEKQDMARDLARMVQDAVAVIPHGANVKLESAGQTQGALHEDFLARQDRAISKILMGQTLTVEMEGANSLAAAETHRSVAEDAGPGVLAPLAAYDEPEDLNTRADLDKKLVEIGVRFTAEHFKENYGLKPEEFTLEGESVEPAGANFAAPAAKKATTAEKAQANLDAAIVKMLPGALKSSAEFVTRLENEIRAARSYEDLEESLGVLLAPSMTPEALETFLARAMTAAAGLGMTAVRAEEEEDAEEKA